MSVFFNISMVHIILVHGILKINMELAREPELREFFFKFFTVNQPFLVHIILVHRF